jgi:hypothetical protein
MSITLQTILTNLTSQGASCRAAAWPGTLRDLNRPGLYAWWVDTTGSQLISTRLGVSIPAGIVYVGQAGAAKDKDNHATLGSRIGDNHISGRIRNSTFRLTVAAILFEELESHISDDRNIGPVGERVVSDWISKHMSITVALLADRKRIGAFEDQVLGALDPPLNLKGMANSLVREALSQRRSMFRNKTVPPRAKAIPLVKSTLANHFRRALTLHDEIADILRGQGNTWMTTSELAAQVNARLNYIKRDRSVVTDYQIHGRTRNYSHLFERDGSRVRLVELR